jgi:uncharacterized membrane protein YecN with MAPEG domain
VNLDCNQSSDPGLWLLPFSSELVDFWIEKGPIACQNNDGAFLKSKRVYNAKGQKVNRKLKADSFKRKLPNGEIVARDWLIYSPSLGCVYCFVCVLFSKEKNQFCKGFADWKHASTMLGCHEKSAHHVKCIRTYIERNSLSRVRRVDCELVKQHEKERNYWIQVLERIVATIKFLANRGLGFRGDDEIISSTRNGNYLGTLELIAQFDPFLNEHIKKYGNAGRGIPSYLSSTICNEFIDVMGQKVLKIIVAEIQESKYFSISVDSTPDVTHVDQLTFTFHYVKQDGPVERFVKFIPIVRHTGEYLADCVLKFLETYKINVMDCRGQSYDNASNMSGQYNGLQARIKAVNEKAEYVPCGGHSLNLIGLKAAECCFVVVAYFLFVQNLYVFFSASHRCNILCKALGGKLVLKRLIDVRWSAHADAVSALDSGYNEIQSALNLIANDEEEEPKTTV